MKHEEKIMKLAAYDQGFLKAPSLTLINYASSISVSFLVIEVTGSDS